jgi:hypothetical protein
MTDYPHTHRSAVTLADEATTALRAALPLLTPEQDAALSRLVRGVARDCCCLVVTAVDEARREQGEGL